MTSCCCHNETSTQPKEHEMIWYDEHLVRALREARLAGRRPRVPRERPAAARQTVTVALQPAPVR
jgi:hypothetical protein